MNTIRAWDPGRDAAAIRALFIELHEVERQIDPRMRDGEAIADAYLEQIDERCRDWDGVLLVAERDGRIVGYACVYRRYVSDELDDPPGEMGYLSDLVVADAARGAGVGRALLEAAEAEVRAIGGDTVRLSVLAGNERAREIYERAGYAPVEIDLEKRLR